MLQPDFEIALPYFNELLENKEKRIVIDLSGVEKIDSSGMQVILDSHSATQNAGGSLRVAGARVAVARLFRITQLDSVVPFFPTVIDACRDFHIRAQAGR